MTEKERKKLRLAALVLGLLFAGSLAGMFSIASASRYLQDEQKPLFYLFVVCLFLTSVPCAIVGTVLVKNREKKSAEEAGPERYEKLRQIMIYAAPAAFIALAVLTKKALGFLILCALVTLWIGRGTREKSAKSMGILLSILAAVPLIICLIVGIKRASFASFRAIDLTQADPEAGDKIVCYNTETERFDHSYTPDGYRAKKPREAGYVVMYKNGTKVETYSYSLGGKTSRVPVTLAAVEISVYDVKKGKTIGKKEVSARPPSSLPENQKKAKSYLDPASLWSSVLAMLPETAKQGTK